MANFGRNSRQKQSYKFAQRGCPRAKLEIKISFARVKAFRFIFHFVFALSVSCRHFQGGRLEYPPPNPLRKGGGFKGVVQNYARIVLWIATT